MKTIIAGSRDFNDYETLLAVLLKVGWHISEVVSGGAHGVDQLGERFAKANGITYTVFKADWDQFGRRAGMLRNKEMANYADACVVIWNGHSSGSADMIETAMNECRLTMVYNLSVKRKEEK